MLKKWIYDTTITLQDSVESWPPGAGDMRETVAGAAGHCAGINGHH